MSTANPISEAPRVFAAPLISAEQSDSSQKIRSAISRALQWVRSLFVFAFPLKEEKIAPLKKIDILRAQNALKIAEKAKPSPIRFVRNLISWKTAPFVLLSLYSGQISSFIAKATVEATTSVTVSLANAFFPAYSEAAKKAIALPICIAAVWKVAGRLGYPQGYFFLFQIGMNVLGPGLQIYKRHQIRKQREAQRATLT